MHKLPQIEGNVKRKDSHEVSLYKLDNYLFQPVQPLVWQNMWSFKLISYVIR